MKQQTRFDEVMNRLSEIPGDVGEATSSAFEAASGEILVRDAPMNRDDYAETMDGYRSYLHDCHEWAIGRYEQECAHLSTEAERLAGEITDYPALGSVDQGATDTREREERAAGNVAETFAELTEARREIKRIEKALEESD